jgi:hypothetical protein
LSVTHQIILFRSILPINIVIYTYKYPSVNNAHALM